MNPTSVPRRRRYLANTTEKAPFTADGAHTDVSATAAQRVTPRTHRASNVSSNVSSNYQKVPRTPRVSHPPTSGTERQHPIDRPSSALFSRQNTRGSPLKPAGAQVSTVASLPAQDDPQIRRRLPPAEYAGQSGRSKARLPTNVDAHAVAPKRLAQSSPNGSWTAGPAPDQPAAAAASRPSPNQSSSRMVNRLRTVAAHASAGRAPPGPGTIPPDALRAVTHSPIQSAPLPQPGAGLQAGGPLPHLPEQTVPPSAPATPAPATPAPATRASGERASRRVKRSPSERSGGRAERASPVKAGPLPPSATSSSSVPGPVRGATRRAGVEEDPVDSVPVHALSLGATSEELAAWGALLQGGALSGRVEGGPLRNAVGLSNLGNTCFMNSMLQCLAHVPALSRYLRSPAAVHSINPKSPSRGKLARALCALMRHMWEAPAMSSQRPTEVKRTVGALASRFLGYEQQDAQEFLRFTLDGLHDDLNLVVRPPPYEEIVDHDGESAAERADRWWGNYEARNKSEIKSLFAGQLRSVVECGICGHVSTAFDPFWDLSVPIPASSQTRQRVLARARMALTSASRGCSLHACLSAFTERERLGPDEGYFCSKCRKHVPCAKQMSVYRWPKVLALHIKRFSYTTFRRDKLTTSVNFPVTGLDFSPYCDSDALRRFGKSGQLPFYDLVAVSNHMGGLGGGHYTADAFCTSDGSWYNFNDSRVSRTDPSSLSRSSAYVLFYVRQDVP